jgi:hypothetical protein
MKKNYYLFILLLAMGSQAMAQKEENQHVIDKMTQMSSTGNIRGLIAALPELEKLWDQDPMAYLESVKINVRALSSQDVSDPEVVKSVVATFSRVSEKKCPPGTESSIIYFESKYSIIGDCFKLREVRENQERFLMAGDFLSEVRSRRIPDYRSKVIQHPGLEILEAAKVHDVADLPTKAQKEAVENAVMKNKEEEKIQTLQGILASIDRTFTKTLIVSGKRMPLPETEKQQFYRSLSTRAKLTKEDQEKLETTK